MIPAGKLDERITVQRRTAGADAHGQQLTTWVDLCTVWAQVITKRGREYIAAGQEQATAAVVFRVRYRQDVLQDAALRVVWRGVAYGVVEPPQDANGQRVYIDVACVAGRKDA